MKDVADVVAEALASHPDVSQVLGTAVPDGLLVTFVGGRQFLLAMRARRPGEALTLYELPDVGAKGLTKEAP